MKLINIQIENYRSIEKISFRTSKNSDLSSTYGLIGVNEAGKSSILKAISLKNNLTKISKKDFKDQAKPIYLKFMYELDQSDNEECLKHLSSAASGETLKVNSWSLLTYEMSFESQSEKPVIRIIIISQDGKHEYSLGSDYLASEDTHTCIFWTAEPKYLITQPIDIASFASSPETISIPLRNCFLLAGIDNIAEAVEQLSDSTEIEYLQNSLSTKVTEHIKSVWPNHPITITFIISNGLINFHIKDMSTSKAKTAEQRSDGFKQFISFLLTISAENSNEKLTNTILLLDEPETHLHPQAQEYLLSELKKITQNERNNIVLFATHSNYMIDKDDLSKNYRVVKENETTQITPLNKKISTYASVTYEVFDIPSSDYHNQLYARLHEQYQLDDAEDEKRAFIKNFDHNFFHGEKKLTKDQKLKTDDNGCCLPTFIRNCIHHPDNGNNFTEKQLRVSTTKMREFLGIS